MRIILYTGKGGVGKTSIAAATALKSAEKGWKTLVVSTDAAHSLGDSFDLTLTSEPQEIQANLWAQEIDTVHEAERSWARIQAYIKSVFSANAIEDITAEELTVFPGMEELLSLLRILDHCREAAYDIIVIDCAPTGETMALLSFPDVMRWWMERIFPIQRTAVKIVRPLAEPILGIPLPPNQVFDEIEAIYDQLETMRRILSDREVTSIRIVVNPEKMVIKEAQRSFTYLNLYDFNIDTVVVNRVIPENVTDHYFQVWKDIQRKYRQLAEDSFAPVPIRYAPLFEQEIVGVEMLSRLGRELFGDGDPAELQYNTRTQVVVKTGEGRYQLSIPVPFTEKSQVALNQKGDELIVKVGALKRIIVLPRTLINHPVEGAKFEEGCLKITFGGDKNG